jgi:hypothetical protein
MVWYRVNKTWLFCFFKDALVITTGIYLPSITPLYSKHKTLSTHQHQQYEVTCSAKHGKHIVLVWKWAFSTPKLQLQLIAW